MSDPKELSWDEAREKAALVASVLHSEKVALTQSLNRTLTRDCVALVDLPTYTTSSMDGWAVRGEGPWKIIGDVKAGALFPNELAEGTAVRIATGAVIPKGTFGVIRWERAESVDNYVSGVVTRDLDIRPAGEECPQGQVLVSGGTKLSPAHIGLLAASGYDEIEVTAKPKIALLLLGDELQLSGIPHGGRVRDSLGPQLPGWLERLGAEVISHEYVTDDLEKVIKAIDFASQHADLVITTGGTADGPRDHIHAALGALNGTFVVDRVRSRPGHPMLLATLTPDQRTVPLLGLPGNPQSAIVGLMTLGVPVIRNLLGGCDSPLEQVKTTSEISAPADFTRLVLGNLRDGHFEIGEHLGSAMLRGLALSTGFAVADSGPTPIGGSVRWLPLP
ncbi:MAG: molybdopterin molybdotransferase MoeA [Candidatus Nanopelagicaceae bacterium]|nr:molybdopterin molybdotransferase MoeA [Candidatus Nanopelagicaceae bacterium]